MRERNAQSSLKVTGWPGAEIEVPPVIAYDVVAIREPWIEYDFMGESYRDVTLPVDTYLREARDVDLGDIEALADFSARFGLLGWWPWPELPTRMSGPGSADVTWLNGVFKACREHRLQQWGEPDSTDEGHDPTEMFYGVVHVDEIRLYLSFVRDMVTLWRCVSGDLAIRDVAAEWANRVFPPPADANDAAMMLADMMNPALARESLRIDVVDPRDVGEVSVSRWGGPYPTTYRALCCQLRNDIAMNADYYVCANKTCGRLFSRFRPDDTATTTRLKAGSRYCSPWCSDAQKQREYRQRRSAGQRATGYKRRPPIKAEDAQ